MATHKGTQLFNHVYNLLCVPFVLFCVIKLRIDIIILFLTKVSQPTYLEPK